MKIAAPPLLWWPPDKCVRWLDSGVHGPLSEVAWALLDLIAIPGMVQVENLSRKLLEQSTTGLARSG